MGVALSIIIASFVSSWGVGRRQRGELRQLTLVEFVCVLQKEKEKRKGGNKRTKDKKKKRCIRDMIQSGHIQYSTNATCTGNDSDKQTQ